MSDGLWRDDDMRRAWDEVVRQEVEETLEQLEARRRRARAWLNRTSAADDTEGDVNDG